MTGIVTTDWKYNGQSSFKFTSSDTVSNFRIDLPYTNVGDTLEASFYCLNNEYSLVLKYYQLKGSAVLNSQSISIPVSNDIQNPVITTLTKETITSIRILVESTNHIGQNLFVDNIKLSKR